MKEGWEYKKIAEICDKASSNIAQNKIENIDGQYPVYGASGFVKTIDFFHREKEYIGVVKDGSGVGRVNIYPAQSSLLGTMQYIIPKEGYSLGFVAYALKGLNLASFASGAAIPHIYFKDYGKCKINVPPLTEQERIVSELDLLTSIINKQKAQLRELDSLAQSIFYDMFGDPIENPKGWEVKKLGEVCRILAGGDKPSDISEFKTKEYLYPVIANGDGEKGILGYSKTYKINEVAVTIGARGASIGNCRIIFSSFTPAIRLIVLIPDNCLHCQYLFYFSKGIKYNINGAGQAQLTVPNITNEKIPLPPLSLQQSFASKIEAIEAQKALITKSMEETQRLFDSRMDYWFA